MRGKTGAGPSSCGRHAARRPRRAITPTPLAAAEPEVSPVSAYAPTRYDAPAGFMSGRGLY